MIKAIVNAIKSIFMTDEEKEALESQQWVYEECKRNPDGSCAKCGAPFNPPYYHPTNPAFDTGDKRWRRPHGSLNSFILSFWRHHCDK